jgi:hypothetical protein
MQSFAQDGTHQLGEDSDPFEAIRRSMRERHDAYKEQILDSQPFQDALHYLQAIASDFLIAHTYVRLTGTRFSASNDYLLFRFAPQVAESIISLTMNAKEGLQNAARRELRFLLETVVKLSERDTDRDAKSFEKRMAGLSDREKRFEDYVAGLPYFDGFEKPEEANAAMLSLYSELSGYVHATAPQFEDVMIRNRRGEDSGMESVSTFNRFNKLAFQVYDLVLVRIFYSLGLSMAGDIFTSILDDEAKWRFHKGKYVGRMSRCFDYKAERRARRESGGGLAD